MPSFHNGLSKLAHAHFNGDSLFAVLSLSTLTTLNGTKREALNNLGIHTVSDLLHYRPIGHARLLMAVARGEIGHDQSKEFLLDTQYLSEPTSAYPMLPAVAVEGVGPSSSTLLQEVFGITTVRQLADFEPYVEAERYLTPDDKAFNEPTSAPASLLPKIVGNIATTATFSDFVKSTQIPLSSSEEGLTIHSASDSPLADAFATRREGYGAAVRTMENVIGRGRGGLFKRIRDSFGGSRNDRETGGGEIQVIELPPASPLYLGYIVSYKQTWTNAGTHLGEVLHSLPLAPGESRNIALVEWYRRQRGEREEDTGTSEQLSNELVYARALSEVINATAQEHLSGLTEMNARTESLAKSKQFGASGGLGQAVGASADLTPVTAAAGVPLPLKVTAATEGTVAGNVGASRVYSENQQQGTLKTESSGRRELLSETMQNIRDTTTQLSEHVRSLWSTVVISDEQTESEEAVTRNVTNYNHSHALTIQYYEVVQKYLTELAVHRSVPVLWLPFRAMDFTLEFVRANWFILRDAISENQELYQEFDNYFNVPPSSALFDNEFKLRTDSNEETDNLGFKITYITIDITEHERVNFIKDLRVELRDNPNRETFSRSWNNDSMVILNTSSNRSFKVSPAYIDGETFATDLELNELTTLTYRINVSRGGRLAKPNRLTATLGCTVRLNFMLEDSNGNTAIVELHEKLRDTNNGEDEDTLTMGGGKYKLSGTWHFTDTTDNLADRLRKVIVDKFDAQGQANEEAESEAMEASIVSHYHRNRYFYTRYLLLTAEKMQLVEVIQSLILRRGFGEEQEEESLLKYVDPFPLAIADNLIALRLRGDVSSNSLLSEEVSALISDLAKVEVPPERSTVYLPTSGVFAEAILGRSNASEFVDLRRFWNWQDSPIPHLAPQIQPLQLGIDRYRDILAGLEPTQQEAVLELLQGAELPAPTTAAVLGALQALSLQDNGTGANALASVLNGLTDLAATTADTAATLSGDSARMATNQATEIGRRVTDLAKTMAKTVTERGAEKKEEPPKPEPEPEPEPEPKLKKRPQAHTSVYYRELSPTEALFLNFPVGSGNLVPQHERYVMQFIERAEKAEDVDFVQGHASRAGSVSANRALSRERALSLVEALEEHTAQSWSRDLVEAVGEDAPTIREMFGAKLSNIPGAGQAEDPVERSVLVKTKVPVFDSEDGGDPDPVPSGDITVTDNTITFGDWIINIDLGGLTLFEGDIKVDFEVGDEKNCDGTHVGYEDNSTVVINNNFFDFGDGSFKIDGPQLPTEFPTRNWEVLFRTPDTAQMRPVFELIEETIRDVVIGQQIDEEEGFLYNYNASSLVDGILDEVEAAKRALADKFVETLLDRLPEDVAEFLKRLYAGRVRVGGHIKNSLSGHELRGTYDGQGLVLAVGPQTDIDALPDIVLNRDRSYVTQQLLTLDDWRNYNPQELSFILEPFTNFISEVINLVKVVGSLFETVFGVDFISELEVAIKALFETIGIYGLVDQGIASRVRFDPFAGGSPAVNLTARSGELEIKVIAYGSQGVTFNVDS